METTSIAKQGRDNSAHLRLWWNIYLQLVVDYRQLNIWRWPKLLTDCRVSGLNGPKCYMHLEQLQTALWYRIAMEIADLKSDVHMTVVATLPPESIPRAAPCCLVGS